MRTVSKIALTMLAALLVTGAAGTAMAEKSDLNYMPADTAIVVSADFVKIKASPLYKQFEPMIKGNADLAKLDAESGFNPTRDLNSVLVGVPADFEKSERFIAVVRGTFDQKKLVAVASAEGKVKEVKIAGTAAYTSDKAGFAFMPGVIVVGDLKSFTAALEAKQAGGKLSGTKLQKLIGKTKTDKDLWVVALVPDEMKKKMGPKGAGLKNVRFSLDLSKGIVSRIFLGLSDKKAAKALAGELSKAKAKALKDPQVKAMGFGEMVKNFKSKAIGKSVSVVFALSDIEVKKLTAMGTMMMMGGGQKGPTKADKAPAAPAAPVKK